MLHTAHKTAVVGAIARMAAVARHTALCSDEMQQYTGLVTWTSPGRCTSVSADMLPEAQCHAQGDSACHIDDGNIRMRLHYQRGLTNARGSGRVRRQKHD